MTTQVLVKVVDEVYDQFRWFAYWTNRDIADVIADSINYPPPKLNPQIYPPVEALSDEAVLALAQSMMPEEQSERHSTLLDKQQRGTLTSDERAELMALLEISHIGMVL